MILEPAPLLSADLYALGDQRIEQAFELQPKSDTNGHGPPVVISSEPNPHIETDKRRLGPSLVPLMIAAVAVLFFFGIVVGTVAASRRGDAHYVRRFAAGQSMLAEWHDHEEKVARVEFEKAEAEKAPPPAPKEPEPAPTPAPSASAAPPPPPPVATATAPKPVWTPPKTTSTTKPATKTTATSKGPTKTAPTSTSKKTGDGNKEWWQKKF